MDGQNIVKPHPAVTIFTFLTLVFDGCSTLAIALMWALLAVLSDSTAPGSDANDNQRLFIAGIVLLIAVAYGVACLLVFINWQRGKPRGNLMVLGAGVWHIVAAIYVASFSRDHSFFTDLLYASSLANLALCIVMILRKANS